MKDKQNNLPGIYIHVPFCQSKCGYCDFYSITDLNLKSPFISALMIEIDKIKDHLDLQSNFDTLYIGGGTPSLLAEKELEGVFEKLLSAFGFEGDTEITLEANPGTLSLQKLKFFRSLGVNRLSIGIQSFLDHELLLLGRIHTAQQAIQTVKLARMAGFSNLSIDLIFALPGQSMTDWLYNLTQAVNLEPEHISAYNLVVEKDTPFFEAVAQKRIILQKEAEELHFYQTTIDFLEANHYSQYEVSSYARGINRQCRHNLKYWTHTSYIGLGPAAHSYWSGKRWGNVSSVTDYIKKMHRGELAIDFEEKIDLKTEEFENIFLSLRTRQGLNLFQFQTRFKQSFTEKYHDLIDKLLFNDLAAIEDDYFKLTRKGLFICDEILANFATN